MLYSKQSEGLLEDVGARLEAAVRKHQFGLLGIIDLRKKMNEKGVPFERGCLIYEVCNPHQAAKVLHEEMKISTMLPCRISVYEDSGTIQIATMLPTEILKAFELPALQGVAEEVEATLRAIIDDAAES